MDPFGIDKESVGTILDFRNLNSMVTWCIN